MMDRLRDGMHEHILQLSSQSVQLQADQSDHFVWVEQPEVMIKAVQLILKQLSADR